MTHQLVLVNCIYSSVKNTHIHNYHKNEQKNRMYLCMRHEKKIYLFFPIKKSYATIKSLKYEKVNKKLIIIKLIIIMITISFIR